MHDRGPQGLGLGVARPQVMTAERVFPGSRKWPGPLLRPVRVRRTLARVTTLLDGAILRATRSLEQPSGERLGAHELGTLLKEMVIGQVVSRLGPLESVRRGLTGDTGAFRRRVVEEIEAALSQFEEDSIRKVMGDSRCAMDPEVVGRLLAGDHQAFLARVGQLALEGIVSEPVAPEPRLRVGAPMSHQELCQRLPGELTHAVVVGEWIGAPGEIFPLMLDAYAHDLASHGRVFVNVIGVSTSWLTDAGEARRILFYEHATRRLWETDLEQPLTFSSCHFLCLGQNERDLHRLWSLRLAGRAQVNPWAASERCDDKYRTYELLAAAGVLTPKTAVLRQGDSLEAVELRLRLAGLGAADPVVVQPSCGTEGAGVIAVELRPEALLDLIRKSPGDLIVRDRIEGLRYSADCEPKAADLRVNVCRDRSGYRAESAYLQVAGSAEDVASSVGRGGTIVPLSEGAFESLDLSKEEIEIAGSAACAAADAVMQGLGDTERLGLVGVDLRLQRRDGRLLPWVLDLNPRPAGLSYSELLSSREPGVGPCLFGAVTAEALSRAVLDLVRTDSDQDHRRWFDGALAVEGLGHVVRALVDYLCSEPTPKVPANLYLLQERAVFLLGDALWTLAQHEIVPERPELESLVAAVSENEITRQTLLRALLEDGDYEEFMAPFLAAANERELRDFARSKALIETDSGRDSGPLMIVDPTAAYAAQVPMRAGISSANASDNWTFAKLRGGKVLNFSVDLAAGEQPEPRPPIEVLFETIDRPVLELQTRSHIETDRPTHVVFDEHNARDLLAVPVGTTPCREACFTDVHDPLLMLKYALVYAKVVGWRAAPHRYLERPELWVDDIRSYARGGGLRLRVASEGPSRSGFASSSCVALGLLCVLYRASGQDAMLEPEMLSSQALLFENELGLKSGKQDTDGPLYPGVKAITYPPTDGFLRSEISTLSVDEEELQDHLYIVSSGIQRPPASGLGRGLNMRHHSYLSRDPERFGAILASLEVHDRIVEALQRRDWEMLGRLFDRYLDLRETIDPGATRSRYDVQAGEKVLRAPFVRLAQAGLIHGGMYTGAMGGGCMLLVATDRGRERVGTTSGLTAALERLRAAPFGPTRPFESLQVYRYAVNTRGLVCSVSPRGSRPDRI